MIRQSFLVLLVFFQSCSIDLGYIQLLREATAQNRIEITDELSKSIDASFIKVSKGRNDAIFVLSNSVNHLDTWVGSNFEKVITYKGLVVKTLGLEYDIAFNTLDYQNNLFISNFLSTISFSNPEYKFAEATFILNEKDLINTNSDCDREIIYTKEISHIGFSFDDWFCFKDNRISRTIQRISPFDDEIIIEFHYKFNNL